MRPSGGGVARSWRLEERANRRLQDLREAVEGHEAEALLAGLHALHVAQRDVQAARQSFLRELGLCPQLRDAASDAPALRQSKWALGTRHPCPTDRLLYTVL